MQELRLGIDVACREAHRAALADETGKMLWRNRKFTTSSHELEQLWAAVRSAGDVPVVVVMEPTRNAWVPLAAWLRARGAQVRMVPPEQSSDLRKYYNKHTKTDRLDCELLAVCRCCIRTGCSPRLVSGRPKRCAARSDTGRA